MAQINPEQLFRPAEEVFPDKKVQSENPKKEIAKAEPKPQTINPEQLFKPREAKKRYIVYLTNAYSTEMNDEVIRLSETVKIDKFCTRQEILFDITSHIEDKYYDITGDVDITAEVLFEVLTSSDVYCMNDETKQFAKTDLAAFFMLFKDENLIDESVNATFHEYIDLITEYSENMMDDDYDADECRDVLNQ